MYNLSVDTAHTFFVGEGQWLVHNANCDARNLPGVVSGMGLPNPTKMMRGTQGNIGVIPDRVATQLRGQSFATFDDFREAFWRAVSNSSYAREFGAANRTRMADGLAPIAAQSQQYGGHMSYVLHHQKPIYAGGGVYDFDNLLIVSPRYHQEVLSPKYHYGK